MLETEKEVQLKTAKQTMARFLVFYTELTFTHASPHV